MILFSNTNKKKTKTHLNDFRISIQVVDDRSRGRPEGSHFNSYYTEVYVGGTQLFSLNCSTLPLIRTLYCWVLSKEVLSTIFKVFGMTWPGIELRFPGSLANTLPTRTVGWFLCFFLTLIDFFSGEKQI